MIIGVILAAGKGTRMNSKDKNKVTLPFLNKPLILYSVELMKHIASKTLIVVGAFSKSVKEVLKNKNIIYAYQKSQLGTAHATKIALKKIISLKLKPKLVLVGYGDHTMFYKKEDVKNLIKIHQKEKSVMTLISCRHNNAHLHWGFIIRNEKGEIIDSIEFKDADEKTKNNIHELNAGFYCFDFNFLRKFVDKVPKSKVSGEYYINSLIKIAVDNKYKVVAYQVPFSSVGIGINRWQELEESQRLYLKLNKENS